MIFACQFNLSSFCGEDEFLSSLPNSDRMQTVSGKRMSWEVTSSVFPMGFSDGNRLNSEVCPILTFAKSLIY